MRIKVEQILPTFEFQKIRNCEWLREQNKNECCYFFYFRTIVFSGVDVFVLWISSSIVVQYFVLKSFDDHIHENESSYA